MGPPPHPAETPAPPGFSFLETRWLKKDRPLAGPVAIDLPYFRRPSINALGEPH